MTTQTTKTALENLRYTRLRDAVLEYLDEGAVRILFEDMEVILSEGKEYHEKQVKNFNKVLNRIRK